MILNIPKIIIITYNTINAYPKLEKSDCFALSLRPYTNNNAIYIAINNKFYNTLKNVPKCEL